MLHWLSCSALTGRVIADLSDLSVSSVGVTLCDYWTGSATLPIPSAPPDWQRATMPMASYLVLLDDEEPIWGGWVTARESTEADTVSLSITSFETYLDRRYVGDVTYSQVEQCGIISDLVARFVAANGPALIVEPHAGATRRDRTYTSDSDKTVLSVLQELSGVDGGPEWTTSWRHLTDPERYVPVLEIRDRIGISPPTGLGPAATFELPGSVIKFTRTEDWSGGAAANHVIATSTADGDVRPESAPQIAADPDRPRLEYRWSPSSSITKQATLNAHAKQALAVMRDGATAIALTAIMAAAPRLGRTWSIGDDIGYAVDCPAWTGSGIARAIAWEIGLDGPETVIPILATDETIPTDEEAA